MGKKLNFPMIATFVIDYSLVISFFSFYFYYNANCLTPAKAVITLWINTFYTLFHDHLHCYLFPQVIAKEKLNYKYTWAHIWDCVSLMSNFSVILALETYYGVFHWRYTTFIPTMMEISFEYWCITLVKDYTMMHFVHPWMHKEENYWLHKHHHIVRTEVQGIHAFSIDFLDGFIENLIGPFLYMIILYFIKGKVEVNLCTYFLTGYADVNVHSLNPFTVVHFSPILEYFHKPVIEHKSYFKQRLL